MVDTPRTIADLQALFADNTSGAISAQDLRDFLVTVVNYLDAVVMAPEDPTAVPLTIRMPTGAQFEGTSPLQIYDEADNRILEVDYLGEVTIVTDGASVFTERLTGSGATSLDPGSIHISSTVDTIPQPFGISHTGDGDVFYVFNTGAVAFQAHTPPADGDLNAGHLALWFDQTNGAAKLMIKGKSENGTVVTGQVALS